MGLKLAFIFALILPLAGLAIATSEQPPTLQMDRDRPTAEITLNLPIWFQLLTPLLTLLSFLAGGAWAVGKWTEWREAVKEKLDAILTEQKNLANSKVSREQCQIEHGQLERRMELLEKDVREARG